MDTERLAQLIDRKQQVLVQLRALSQRQHQMVTQGELGSLIALLAAKQRVLNELQAVETELVPFRAEDPERRRWRSTESRQRARQAAQQCASLLEEIMRIESQCETEMVQRREAAAARLQQAQSASHAREAYASSGAPGTSHFDVSSDT